MSTTHRFTGTRELDAVVEFLSAIVFIEYPTPTTWEADVVLEPDKTEYFYRFLKRTGAYTPYFTATVTRKEEAPQSRTAFNILDQWGTRMDTKRIDGEANLSYRTRLLDVFTHRGGPLHDGLINAIARDLDLDYADQALIITRADNSYTGEPFITVYFEVSSTKVHIRTPEFFRGAEEHLVPPVNRVITPSFPLASDLEITTLGHVEVDWEYDQWKNEIHILDDIGGQVVRLSYFYRVEISRMDTTLAELETAIEAVLTPSGDQVLNVAVASAYVSKSAENLSIMAETLLQTKHKDVADDTVTGLPVRWTDMRIEAVWDRELHEHIRNWTGSLWNTKVDSAYRALVNLSKSTWGTAVADESVWSSVEFPLHGGQHIDTIYDAPLGYWEDPRTGARFDSWQIATGLDNGFAVYKGVRQSEFQSGVGGRNDLKVVVGMSERTGNTGTADRDEVSGTADKTTIPTGTLPTEGGVDL